jgi:hypothetical protein
MSVSRPGPSEEAFRFFLERIERRDLPQDILNDMLAAITAPTPREINLRAAKVTALDTTAPRAARLAALRTIVMFIKGDL